MHSTDEAKSIGHGNRRNKKHKKETLRKERTKTTIPPEERK